MELNCIWKNCLCFLIFLHCVNSRPRFMYQKTFTEAKSRLSKRSTKIMQVCPKTLDHVYNDKNRKCGINYSSCSADPECPLNLICCFDGCISRCLNPVTDLKGSDYNKKPINVNADSIEVNAIQKCKTSSSMEDIFYPPCPSGYVCDSGNDETSNIGICIKAVKVEELEELQPMIISNAEDSPDCIYADKVVRDKQHFLNDCSLCFCSNTVINCKDPQPGCIPASIKFYKNRFAIENNVDKSNT